MNCEDIAGGRLVFLRDQFGLFRGDQLPDVAAGLLVLGYDAPALRELAGHSRKDPVGAHDLWARVREELRKPFEDDGVARRVLVRNWLCEIVDGILAPRTGAGLIYTHGWLAMGQPAALDKLVVLLDDWDDMPQNREEICRDLLDAARTVLDGW